MAETNRGASNIYHSPPARNVVQNQSNLLRRNSTGTKPHSGRNDSSLTMRPTPDFSQKANIRPSPKNETNKRNPVKRSSVMRNQSNNARNRAVSGISGNSGVLGGGTAVRNHGFNKKKNIRVKSEKKVRERLSKFDYPFFTIVMVLLVFGIIMMFSASYAFAYKTEGDSYYYVSKQINFIILGLIAMIFISFLDYHIMLNKYILIVGLGVSVVLMAWVKVSGVTQFGAERWLSIGGITIQPSEILKFAIIMTFAYFAHKRADRIRNLSKGFTPLLLCLMLACGLTLMQPHLSGTIIIFCIGIVMMFVGNCKVKHIILMCIAFILLAALGLLALKTLFGYDYFGDRILSWQNPEADITDKTFQTYQSLVTIGSGGMFGLGLGNSRQKYSYLPASHNDFIFSVICEELGFVGAILVILIFVMFIFRGFYIAIKARDKFGMLLAVGITSQIGIQALMNIAVVTNSMPNTGISLPFFSYGGSALMMQLAEIGVVLNISRKAAT